MLIVGCWLQRASDVLPYAGCPQCGEIPRTININDPPEKFREVDGLVQKFYLQEEASGRVGGFYVFDSESSRDAFFASDLRDSIGEAYAVKGEPNVSMCHLLFPLREAEEFPTPA